MRGNFKEDLLTGEKAELYILEQLKDTYPTIRKQYGYNKGFDLIDDNGYTAEVKYDRESIDTHNIAFEYKYKGEPSGISTSKAIDWIQIYYSDKWVYSQIRKINLQSFLKSNIQYFKRVKGGDDMQSCLILVPTSEFEKSFVSTPILLNK